MGDLGRFCWTTEEKYAQFSIAGVQFIGEGVYVTFKCSHLFDGGKSKSYQSIDWLNMSFICYFEAYDSLSKRARVGSLVAAPNKVPWQRICTERTGHITPHALPLILELGAQNIIDSCSDYICIGHLLFLFVSVNVLYCKYLHEYAFLSMCHNILEIMTLMMWMLHIVHTLLKFWKNAQAVVEIITPTMWILHIIHTLLKF